MQIYNGNEPYIFISYALKDNATVLPFIEALQGRGFLLYNENSFFCIHPSGKTSRTVALTLWYLNSDKDRTFMGDLLPMTYGDIVSCLCRKVKVFYDNTFLIGGLSAIMKTCVSDFGSIYISIGGNNGIFHAGAGAPV